VPIWRQQPVDELASNRIGVKIGDHLSVSECENLAVKAALLGAGKVSPNPMVGAVAVDSDGKFLAFGSHLVYGENHAEANLLEKIKGDGNIALLKDATIYVTFEPCAHAGKTPSCAKTLSQYPIKKIIYALLDPNPVVDGKGVEIMRDAGIECEQSVSFGQQARFLTDIFSWQIKFKSPYFGLKAATSADGIYSKQEKANKFWITSERSRQYGHWLRYFYNGIMIGSGTLLIDNPSLDARHPEFTSRHPEKIVFDPTGHALENADFEKLSIFSKNPDKVTWIAKESAWKNLSEEKLKLLENFGSKKIALNDGERIDPADLVKKLSELNLDSILLEGGAGLWCDFLNWQLVNKIHLFQSSKFIGGVAGRGWLDKLEVESEIKLCNTSITALGDDWLIEGDLRRADF